MRTTIGLKIFSIAMVLLLLMIAVAVISTYSVRGVRKEMATLSECYIPTTQTLSRIEVHVLRQLIHLERIRALYHGDPSGRPAIPAEKKALEEAGAAADREVSRARDLVGSALANRSAAEDRVELARVETGLAGIATERREFHDILVKILDLLDRGQEAQAELLLSVLGTEKRDVDAAVDDLRQSLQNFTRDSASAVAQHIGRVVLLSWTVTLLAVGLGLVFALNVTRGLVKPVLALLKGTREVERGNLNAEISVRTHDEIGLLAQSFNHMLAELRVKERIKDTFGKYVDPRIVESLIENSGVAATAGRREIMTIAFSDIEGFTAIGEGMTPSGLVNLLNRYFEVMSQPIRERQGIIDKYIGDAIMAFWGPPFTAARDHARLACCAALDQMASLEAFRGELPELMGIRKGLPQVNVRIGISTGDVVVGNIGSEFSKGYTVIGDTVNLGSRLEGANKHYGTRVLICETTQALAGGAVETRELDAIRVAGKSEPVRIFELLAASGQLRADQRAARDRFEDGLQAYRRKHWSQARAGFQACLEHAAQDGPARLFLSRAEYFESSPPPADWDGVWTLPCK